MALIDLTHPLHSRLPVYWPWHPKTDLSPCASYEENKCQVHKLTVGTHSGTHIDAPSHFYAGAKNIDELPLELWVAEAQVVDFAGKKAREEITREEMEAKDVERGKVVIIRTGWGKHHGREDYYQTYPPVSREAAAYLLECDVPYLAADTPFNWAVHELFLSAGRPLITNLNRLDRITRPRVRLYAFPLLLEGADGAPARVIAEQAD
ncbi:MAG: cyclase family protein [Candidatus Tectomicrobia bacterium]|nr:cyclase family protein [Candidatus Tectomicrobia bacterium]